MLRLASDADVHGSILRGLRRRLTPHSPQLCAGLPTPHSA
jgi:hypothetical protein